MVLKNPFFFGAVIVVLFALQAGASYLSFQSFLGGEWLRGFLFLLAVPALAFLMVLSFIRFRRERMDHLSGPENPKK